LLLDESSDEEEDKVVSYDVLKKGDFRFLVGHPEDFLKPQAIEMLRKTSWRTRVSHIIVDEAHCVVQWSGDFRTAYREIDELKVIFPNAAILAVTATATTCMQKDIMRLLNFANHENVVVGQSNRENIRYVVKQRPPNSGKGQNVEDSYTSVFAPYLTELKQKRETFPKTVVYTMLKWCGFGNELAVQILSDGTLSRVQEVQQYHAPLTSEVNIFHIASNI
jgi:superfamily II DNA helicase RecQ